MPIIKILILLWQNAHKASQEGFYLIFDQNYDTGVNFWTELNLDF